MHLVHNREPERNRMKLYPVILALFFLVFTTTAQTSAPTVEEAQKFMDQATDLPSLAQSVQ